ncbi:RNase HII [Litoreibacter ponti]|uniref:Ribonuclease HII n=1 Tax=Litoreibacter ponti TaxID=1510457 RepID=A0A2T6BNX9_9RHOB|nr:ribonuclease HII [Litoreibacter ponti]PTX57756.1 RNase HII [Litoreibacter ponti]
MGIPDFSHEADLIARGIANVAGTDEAGRGPLAGPVVAAAVILDPNHIPDGLNDSKKLSAKKREVLFAQIMETARCSIAQASVGEIDALNIYHASHLAMSRAVAGLGEVGHVLVDGNKIPAGICVPATPLVRGDGRSQSIAAASILAKVTRDRHMDALAQQHPGYGWEKNAGYPTKGHISALIELGVTPHHRRSFKPVHNILCHP